MPVNSGSSPTSALFPKGAGVRKENVVVVKPLIIGTYAFMLSEQELLRRKSCNDSATHRWHCILRAPNNEDTSYYIRKVVFNLHSSFVNPQRTFEKPPYEFNEVGWGEFEIVVKIFFGDPNERTVELRHWLRLYPPVPLSPEQTNLSENHPQCVATEIYDEIYFNDPHESFYDILTAGPLLPPLHYEMARYFLKTHNQEEYLAALLSAISTVNRSIENATVKATSLTLELAKLKELYYTTHEDKALSVLNKEKFKFLSPLSS